MWNGCPIAWMLPNRPTKPFAKSLLCVIVHSDWPSPCTMIGRPFLIRSITAAYRDEAFPVTIVRPSFTYGDTWIPCAIAGLGYTVIDRMRNGRPIIVHGDGQSLWTMTHNSDFAKGFVGLFGSIQAIGQPFHITSDEVLTWDQIYGAIGAA